MPHVSRKVLSWLKAFGVEPWKTRGAIRTLPATLREYSSFRKQNEGLGDSWNIALSEPSLHDRLDSGGAASGHYFHQDLLVARRIYEREPKKHVDVGSRVDGFVAHVAVFREIEVVDIRPQNEVVSNISFVQKDLMDANAIPADYCDSLSCLHALEHFGLGRYGDPIDVVGYEKGFDALTRMLQSGGILYLSVPIGRERVEFNGQRVFALDRLERMYQGRYNVKDFSFVNDEGCLVESVDLRERRDELSSLNYGCGIFELQKV